MEQKSLFYIGRAFYLRWLVMNYWGKNSPRYKLVLVFLKFILFWVYVCFLTTKMSHTQRHHAAVIFGEKQTQLVV